MCNSETARKPFVLLERRLPPVSGSGTRLRKTRHGGFGDNRFVFDAREKMVRWKNRLFVKVSAGSLAFDEIRDIGIESSAGGDGGSPSYRLTILTSGGSIPLGYSYSPGNDKYTKMRATILAFLKPGSQEGLADLEPSVLELLRAGRKIDAIALLRSMEGLSLTEAKLRVDKIKNRLEAKS